MGTIRISIKLSTKHFPLALVLLLILSACSSSTSFKTDNRVGEGASGDAREVLEVASELQGTPYKYAGSDPDGFDCSGYTSYCYAKAGIKLPRTSRSQYTTGKKVNEDELEPGDLVFFNTSGKSVSHVGIYTGSGKFIHASTSNGVMVSKLSDRYWAPRYVGARRVLPN